MHLFQATARILAVLMLFIAMNALPLSASHGRTLLAGSDHSADSSLVQVKFEVGLLRENSTDLNFVHRYLLQRTVGVRYVGVNYNQREVVVRYDASLITLETIQKILAEMPQSSYSLVSNQDDSSAVKRKTSADTVTSPVLSDFQLECLHHEAAHALCEEHFKGVLPDDFELEKCYAIKVDFQTVAHIDSTYDWLDQACLVDSDGRLIQPIMWLELPAVGDGPVVKPGTGLLIFPKVPILRGGLFLRFLRADGDGYSSFMVDVPNP